MLGTNRFLAVIIILLCVQTLSAQRGVTYPYRYSTVGLVSQSPDQVIVGDGYGRIMLDTSSATMFLFQDDSTWVAPSGSNSMSLFENTIVYDKAGVNDSISMPYDRAVVENIALTDLDIQVESTRGGVTANVDAIDGEITIGVPADCELRYISMRASNNVLDASNRLYIILDYEGLRDYNLSVKTARVPYLLIGGANSPSRSTPLVLSEDGEAGVIYGISSFGQGDGSDLELTLRNALISSNINIKLIF